MKKLRKISVLALIMFILNIVSPNMLVFAETNNVGIEENTENIIINENIENLDEDVNEEVTQDNVNDSKEESNFIEKNISENELEELPQILSEDEEITPLTSDAKMVLKIDNPINNQKLTEAFQVRGYALSMEKISKVEVYLDNVKFGTATYGITREDVKKLYPDYPEANASGFTYNFPNVSNGQHTIKVLATDVKGNTLMSESIIVNISNVKTPIMGTGSLQRGQMINILMKNNPALDFKYISDFVDLTIKEAKAEGVNHDILFAQMMKETGFLKFGGDVKPEQNNFAGIGATGNGAPGNSFPSVEIGIRAVVQHLKAYASTEPLNLEKVDPRFDYVTRGTAIYVEHLGIQENPKGTGWAAARGYGYEILDLIEVIRKYSSEVITSTSIMKDITVSGELLSGKTLTIKGTATPENETLYRIWACYRDTEEWILLSDWSTKNTAIFTPTKSGNYSFVVHAKHKNSNTATQDDYKSKDVTVFVGKSTATSLDVTGDKYVNQKLTMSATGTPEEETLYKLWVCDRSTDTWTVLSGWSKKSSVNFLVKKPGKYTLVAHVKSEYSKTTTQDDYKSMDIEIKEAKSVVNTLNVTGNTTVGSTLTMTATADPAADTLYKLWVCDRSTDTWTVLSDWSTKNTTTFIPKKSGNYSFVVHVKNKYSATTTQDSYKSVDLNIKSATSKVTSLNVTGDRKVGSTLTMTATAEPAADSLYKLWVCDRSTETWTVLSDWSTKSTTNFVPKKEGQYSFVVHVKHKNSATTSQDDYKSLDLTITSSKSKVNTLTVTGNKSVGSTLTMTATAEPSTDSLYKLWVCDRSTDTWTVLSDWSTKNTTTFVPKKSGKYSFVVHVKHKNSVTTSQDDYKSIDLDISYSAAKVKSLELTGGNVIGNQITMTAEAENKDNTLYKLWVCDRSTETWTVLSDWSTNNTVKFTPNKKGYYSFVVHVKNKYSNTTTQEDYLSKDIYAHEKDKSDIISLNVKGSFKVNEVVTIESLAEPKENTLYKIWICKRDNVNSSKDEWILLSDWSEKNSVTYTPKTSGTYSVVVHIKHKNSKLEKDEYTSRDIDITSGKKLIVIDPGHNYGGDYGAVSTINGIKYDETVMNMQVALKLRLELISRGYDVVMTREEGDRETIPMKESLEKRVKIANDLKADLFISIHHNSNPVAAANGVEVYYTSVPPILGADKVQNGLQNKISYSSSLAKNIASNISSSLGTYNRGAKDDDFYVVKNTLMPSVLVECGFLTNPEEAKKIADPNNQLKIAKAISDAVQKQF